MDGKLGPDPRVHVGVGPVLKSGHIHFTVNICWVWEGEALNSLTCVCGSCSQTELTQKAWQKVMYEWGPMGCPPLSLLPVPSHHPAASWPDVS